MKIVEIIENPVSGLKTGMQRLGGRILRRIPGMKGKADNLIAKSLHGKTARNAYNKFQTFLGNRNKSMGQATGDDLKDYVATFGLDSSGIQSGPASKEIINSVMIDIATQIKSKRFKTGLSNTTPSDTPPSNDRSTRSQGNDARETDSYEKAKSLMRNLESPQGQPLPDKMLQQLASDIQKLSKGDKESGVYAADKIMKFAKAGRDISGIQQRWLHSAKAGERFLTQSVYRFVSNLLTEYNLTWKDLGLKIRLTESQNRKHMIMISKI